MARATHRPTFSTGHTLMERIQGKIMMSVLQRSLRVVALMQTRYSRSNIRALAPNSSSEACVRTSQQQQRRGLGGAAVVAERGLPHEMPIVAASKINALK
ncbi:hypothetical protein J3459_017033 [Metarhizium acridum]|nr:hypothetical protein J3459_016651 [Metarhizium acridum]KAG8410611.1 hypothetical protein J3459_017033 [Metarhizium acridum]